MKLYILEVDYCDACPYSRWEQENLTLCFHPHFSEDGYKEIVDNDVIPKWCPLPDKGKTK